MKIVETLGRHVPEAIKRHRTLHVATLDGFTERVAQLDGQIIDVATTIKAVGPGTNSSTVGRIGDYEYLATYTSKSRAGGTISCTETYLRRFGSERGIADAQERSLSALRLLLTAEQRSAKVRQRIPGVRVNSPLSQMSEDIRKRFAEDVERFKVIRFVV